MSSTTTNLLTSSLSTTQAVTQATLNGLGNLIKLLPTGTVFTFHFLNPILTNYGKCNTLNKYLSGILIALCGFSCCFSSFTDSFTDSQGNLHYGIVTTSGLWPTPSSTTQDLSPYRLRLGDFVHAFFSLIVFGVVSLLDDTTIECFYPSLEKQKQLLLQILPLIIGTVASGVFVLFPNTRNGIGYPSSSTSQTTTSTSTTQASTSSTSA